MPPLPVCIPTRPGERSKECSGHGGCRDPGVCACAVGYQGRYCEHVLNADGTVLRLLPANHVAQVHFVWGVHPRPTRSAFDGTPLSASLATEQRPLLRASSQELIANLCDALDEAPPWRVRSGSTVCPLRELRQSRLATGRTWPVPETEAVASLMALAEGREWGHLIGVNAPKHEGDRLEVTWLAVTVATNTLAQGGVADLRAAAAWFEAVSEVHNAAAASTGASLRGWQTSRSWVWMEALDEAVSGAVSCVLGGALLTMATLILFTRSVQLACATVGGVVCVLICFLGYLAQRGYAIGAVEAIATTIFIGLSCDYCVHCLQAHRAGGGSLRHTLISAGPSLWGAAMTTAGAAAPLLFCRVMPFQQLGEFIIVCTAFSLAISLGLLTPLLSISPCTQCTQAALHPPARLPLAVAQPAPGLAAASAPRRGAPQSLLEGRVEMGVVYTTVTRPFTV